MLLFHVFCRTLVCVGLLLSFCVCDSSVSQAGSLHPWLGKKKTSSRNSLQSRFPPPRGFRRVKVRRGSFAWWLRRLPLMPKGTPIRDYRGRVVDQSARAAVVRLDVGRGNLQQCADVVMRLWGEYLWYRKLQHHYQFRLTSGHRNPWSRYAKGDRLRIVRGRMRGWRRRVARRNYSYRNFRRYLRVVMMFSGTASLGRELKHIRASRAGAGDLLLQGGFPGHTSILLDEVRNTKGQRLFLLGQGFMPAQSFHVVRSEQRRISPWFKFPRQGAIPTPSWNFTTKHFYRLPHLQQTR